MRVAHIAYAYGNLGGAAIAASRLHDALLAHGEESYFICVRKEDAGQNVIQLPQHDGAKWLHQGLINLTRRIWKLSPYGRSVGINVIPLWGLRRTLAKIRPDVVHVHWINDCVLSFEQLARIDCPAVINLHDLYMVNALDAHPQGDTRYVSGFDRTNSDWITRYVFRRKQKAIKSLHPVFIAPSEWCAKVARESIIAKDCYSLAISNLVRREFFSNPKPNRRYSKFRILFIANAGLDNPYKGFPDLMLALNLLPQGVKQQMTLVVAGDDDVPDVLSGIEVQSAGRISDVNKVIEVYDSVDCLAFPSRYETQGLTKVESLLRGRPVICFDRSACAESIEHKRNGWIAPDGDVQSYCEGIRWWFSIWSSGKLNEHTDEIVHHARELYSDERILAKTLTAYEQATKRDRNEG